MAARRARLRPDDLLGTVAAFQLAAVQAESQGTVDMLEEQGITAPAEGVLVPAALAGVASDGRDLGSLLTIPDLTDDQFDRIVATQLQDIARQAASIERGMRPGVTTYVRAVNLPACGRCIILAGRPQKSETAFRRHPRCDCSGVPSTDRSAEKLAVTPADAFARLSVAEREKAFTKAGAEAILLGADPAQVVNARRGMEVAQYPSGSRRITRSDVYGVFTTREGAWVSKHGRVRGSAAKTMRANGVKGPRLMPESIAELASTPDEHIRLLKAYGYIR